MSEGHTVPTSARGSVRWDWIDRGYESPCRVWTKARDTSGYGRQRKPGQRLTSIHRDAYEVVYGPIPAGHQIHHKCEQKDCFRLDHMEALSLLEHRARHRTFDYEEAASLRRQGWTYREIAPAVGASRGAVERALRRMAERGEL